MTSPVRALTRRFRRWAEDGLRAAMPPLLEWWTQRRFPCGHGRAPHGLPAPLVVSVTSHPPRFARAHLALQRLLCQDVAADHTVLWIARQHLDLLPPTILALREHGLDIRPCDDLRSYKKIIPALQAWPDAFIVTADDDLYYRQSWLGALVQGWRGDGKEAVCHRAHRMRLDSTGTPLPYAQWEIETRCLDADGLIFPTGGAGALWPPGLFDPAVQDQQAFLRHCPDADDLWLWWMMRRGGGRARKVGRRRLLYTFPGADAESLSAGNLLAEGNDRQILALTAAYGFPAPA